MLTWLTPKISDWICLIKSLLFNYKCLSGLLNAFILWWDLVLIVALRCLKCRKNRQCERDYNWEQDIYEGFRLPKKNPCSSSSRALNGSTARAQQLDLSLSTTLLLIRTPGIWSITCHACWWPPWDVPGTSTRSSERLLPTTSCWPGAAAGAAGEG